MINCMVDINFTQTPIIFLHLICMYSVLFIACYVCFSLCECCTLCMRYAGCGKKAAPTIFAVLAAITCNLKAKFNLSIFGHPICTQWCYQHIIFSLHGFKVIGITVKAKVKARFTNVFVHTMPSAALLSQTGQAFSIGRSSPSPSSRI